VAAFTVDVDPPPSGGPSVAGAAAGCAAEHAVETTKSPDASLMAQNDRSETLVRTYEEEYRSPTLGNIPARFRSERPCSVDCLGALRTPEVDDVGFDDEIRVSRSPREFIHKQISFPVHVAHEKNRGMQNVPDGQRVEPVVICRPTEGDS